MTTNKEDRILPASQPSTFTRLDPIFSDPAIAVPDPQPVCCRCPAAFWGLTDGNLNAWCRMMGFWSYRLNSGTREVCRARDIAIEALNQK